MSIRGKLSGMVLGLVFLAAAAGIGALAAWWGYNRGKGTSITDTGPAVIQLEKLTELATVRVHVADVLKAENTSWMGDIKGAWLIKGDALLSVDLKAAKVLATDERKKVHKVQLPLPRVIQPRVDHKRTIPYDWQKGWLRSNDVADAVWKDAMKHAQELVEQLAGEPEQMAVAKDQTQAALKQVYSSVGWTLEIVWEDGHSPGTASARSGTEP
jgi:hypothetical protein